MRTLAIVKEAPGRYAVCKKHANGPVETLLIFSRERDAERFRLAAERAIDQ